tara:strand:+ start:211 stop:1074 length:864 start_codon:yes stop_codon:yes gene_type:complete
MSLSEFCHIVPIPHLNLTEGRSIHLVLAHLIEQSDEYCNFYLEQKEKYNCKIIMDNSAFEMFKAGKPMYPSEKLLEMGTKIKADWIVMSDYPGEPGEKTIEAAKQLAPLYHDAGFGTFFVPQGTPGNSQDLINSFKWASNNSHLVDYIGMSILAAPLAYGVESGNKLQRFASRLKLMYQMDNYPLMANIKNNNQQVHFLGMVDGPNEIMFMSPFSKYIDTWDSSAACWLGLNGQTFDETPTGRRDGKFEKEVDFMFKTEDDSNIRMAINNMEYIDKLTYAYLYRLEV